jgi:hypothetical protein
MDFCVKIVYKGMVDLYTRFESHIVYSGKIQIKVLVAQAKSAGFPSCRRVPRGLSELEARS